MKNILSRGQYITEKNKVQRVIDKIPVDELPEAEDFDSEIGSYLSSRTLRKCYSDAYDDILDRLGSHGIFYHEAKHTFWQKRENGLVRIH